MTDAEEHTVSFFWARRRLGEVDKRCWLVMEGMADMEPGQIGTLRNGETVRVRWTGLDETIEDKIEEERRDGKGEADEQEVKEAREYFRRRARRWRKE
ncbi:hypothetical protein Q9L58_008807 [Maublancomyces gigas]|uniref:Uncharacterized protein n=1 Tax=Discina gigas TaxID=1032678 RepID=A0ABR3G8P7_9PEZI